MRVVDVRYGVSLGPKSKIGANLPPNTTTMASTLILSTTPSSFTTFIPKFRNPNPNFNPTKTLIPKFPLNLTSISHITPKFTTATLNYTLNSPQFRRKLIAGASAGENSSDEVVVGEDSAAFELRSQKLISWVYFGVVLGVVLFALNYLWIDNDTGFGKDFIAAIENVSDSPEVVMLTLTIIFAAVHSGLASFRNTGEKIIGERAFRVLFAGVSLPLAVSTVVYFINHRYDGVQLWQLQSLPGLHQFLWISNFISFLFLYPSTFNLLEVAAVDKPKMHLWETGIMRITRHPQMVGQIIWCLAHTLWIGNSVAVAASVGLIGHHLFGIWNGDRRLALRHGEAFQAVKNRTSIIPFAAILDGRQILPKDYYKEFIRLPYLAVTAVTLGAYFAHPLMQSASFRLHW